jgi:hypothetical protein
MRSWWIVLVTGCWTTASPIVDTPKPPAPPSGTCVIRDRGIDPISPVELAMDAQVFATLRDPVEQLELRVTGEHVAYAAAHVETDVVELEGELPLAEFRVRPRGTEMYKGWLGIETSYVRGARGNMGTLEVPLPHGLRPTKITVEFACDQITTIKPPERPSDRGLGMVFIKQGTPLLQMPGAKPLAQILGPDQLEDGGLTVHVLERRDGMLRVRLVEPNIAVGWIAATATEPGGGGTGYGYGVGGLAGRRPQVSCSTGLPIFVRSPRRGEVRVGRLKPNRSLIALTDPAGTEPVFVKLDGAGELKPYVRPADLAACPR